MHGMKNKHMEDYRQLRQYEHWECVAKMFIDVREISICGDFIQPRGLTVSHNIISDIIQLCTVGVNYNKSSINKQIKKA